MVDATQAAVQISRAGAIFCVILVVSLVLIAVMAFRSRKHSAQISMKLCAGCATPHPVQAQFCRKCGRKIG